MHFFTRNIEWINRPTTHVSFQTRVSHSRFMTRELDQPIKKKKHFLLHESRLASSPPATRDTSLAICDLRGRKSRVTNCYSPLVTRDLGPPKSRIACGESRARVTSSPIVTCDLESRVWLVNLTCGSRIATHGKSLFTNNKFWRANDRDSRPAWS